MYLTSRGYTRYSSVSMSSMMTSMSNMSATIGIMGGPCISEGRLIRVVERATIDSVFLQGATQPFHFVCLLASISSVVRVRGGHVGRGCVYLA